MANAFSGKITDKDISFGGDSYISTSSEWIRDKGSVTTGSQIVMGADSKCHIHIDFDDEKANYLKLQIKLTSNDTSLTTDNFHAVSGLCDIVTEDANNNLVNKHTAFYPKYIFEENYTDDFTIIQLNANNKLKSINITLINKEDVAVIFLITGLYLSKTIDEDTLADEVINNHDIRDYIDDIIREGCFLRLLETQAELSTVQEGELCRCAWIS